MWKIVLPLQLIVFCVSSIAQPRQITGRVIDASTNKPVSNASVVKFGTIDGTVTNQLGFFSLPIETNNKSLVISCIGYLTSKIDIPEVGQFKVLLEKDFRELIELDLGKFKYRTLPQPDVSIAKVAAEGAFEIDAEYPGGWEYFYNDVGFLLKTDSVYNILLDSIRQVRFTVEKDGRTTAVNESPGSVFVPQSLQGSFGKLKRWRPALQNKVTTAQHFELPIKWTKQLKDSSEEIFTIVEVPAHPKNGMPEFYRYLASNIAYPAAARSHRVAGRVFVEFIIEKDGRISDVRVIKGIGFDCDKEAVRVVSSSPNWIPGKRGDEPVKQRMVMPIIFKLDGPIYFNDKNGPVYFNEFIYNYIRYPAQARREGIEGWVIIKFNVNKETGEIRAIETIRDIGGGCAESVIDALHQTTPEIISNLHKTREMFVLPVSFGLGKTFSGDLNYNPTYGEELLAPVFVRSIGIERDRKVTGSSFSSPRPVFGSFEDLLSKDPKSTLISANGQKLKSIPSLINKFHLLSILALENNEIDKIPLELTEVTKLKEIYLKGNHIKDLPESLSNLDSLRILGLAENEFAEFPMVVTKLENLVALDLSGNQIVTIPPEIKNLKKLKSLFLQNNKITSLPTQLLELKGLKKLYLYGNEITQEDKVMLKKALKKTEIRFK